MIKKLYVDNYKCLVNFELELDELSLLLGPSGVGKTAVLDVVYALRRLLDGDARIVDSAVFPPRTLTRWQSRDIQVFEIQVLLDAETYTYRLEVEHQRAERLARVSLERLDAGGEMLFECVRSKVQLYRDDPNGGVSKGPEFTADWRESALARIAPDRNNRRLSRFLDYMRKVLVCSIHSPGLKTVSVDESPLLARDAGNFADWYRHTLQEHTDLVPELTTTLAEVIDTGFKGIRLERVGHESRSLMVSFGDHELRFDEVSDGQRALIVLYALIHLARDQGYTLLLDEPENYVALREIQPWLISLEDACGDTLAQAVISSHHPELIDYLAQENGLLLQRESSGAITSRRPQPTSEDGTQNGAGLKLSELIARGWE